MATSALGAIRTMRQRERARAFPYTLGTFSVKERVFPYALGTFSIKEYLLVLWYNSYNAAKRESISLYFGYDLVSKSVSLYFGYV
jgi:hypothetical protein